MRLIAQMTLKKISTSQDFSREERKFPDLFYLSLSLLCLTIFALFSFSFILLHFEYFLSIF